MGGKREEEEGRRKKRRRRKSRFGIHVWNFGLEHLFYLKLLYLLVWNLFVWICWLGNPHGSLFAYVWGLKNPISVLI